MPSGSDDLLPNAKDFMKKLAHAKVEEAAKASFLQGEADAEKRALLSQLEDVFWTGNECIALTPH